MPERKMGEVVLHGPAVDLLLCHLLLAEAANGPADAIARDIHLEEELVAGGAGSHALSRLMLRPLGRSKPAPLRGCTMLEDVELALLPEDAAEDTADLPDGDVVLDALDEHRHQVGLRTGRVFEQFEQAVDFRVVAFGADAIEAVDLGAGGLGAEAQKFSDDLAGAAESLHAQHP